MLHTVLIVEDSTLQAQMYRTFFRKYFNCRLVYALDGMEALNQLTLEKDIDLIILDINMPKMDGHAFLKSMRQNGHDNIPVIVISTEGQDEDIRRALKAGAAAYIKKPWKPIQIMELIKKVIIQEKE